MMGVTSWEELMAGSAQVGLDLEGDSPIVHPSRNVSSEKGFMSLPEKDVEIPARSPPAEIGSAIEAGFAAGDEGPPISSTGPVIE
jgi:hypothetical protein